MLTINLPFSGEKLLLLGEINNSWCSFIFSVLPVLILASGYFSSRIGTVIDDILVGILPSLFGSLSQS